MGRSSVLRFLEEGANVVIAEINGHVLRAAVEEAEKISHRVTGVQTDVTKESDVKRVVDRAVEAFGTVDVLFNNAGLNHAGLLHETTLEDWEIGRAHV